LFTIDGKRIVESDFGVCEAERGYQKQIDVSQPYKRYIPCSVMEWEIE
jgi:hypothetical protein